MTDLSEKTDRASLLALFRSNATDVVEKDMSHVTEASVIGHALVRDKRVGFTWVPFARWLYANRTISPAGSLPV